MPQLRFKANALPCVGIGGGAGDAVGHKCGGGLGGRTLCDAVIAAEGMTQGKRA